MNVVRPLFRKFGILAALCILISSCNNGDGKYPIIDPIRSQNLNSNDSGRSLVVSGQTTKATTINKGTLASATAKNIFETISLSVDHSLFLAAIEASGYEELLSDKKECTVFAPDDNAFKALPRNILNSLLKPSYKDQLKKLISNHIVNKKFAVSDLKDGTEVKTISGKSLIISNKGGRISIANGVLISTDASCSNGYLNVINQVIQ